MTWNSFVDLFRQATGRSPFPYQERLAALPDLPHLVDVPTGAGKTAALALAWLWRRRYSTDLAIRAVTPRRLVYCLPMRVLVEQTVATIAGYLSNLSLDGSDGIRLFQLMGGDADDDWLLYPEADAILVGTQDMLLSRALNRGYGMSRFRWPPAFGLLHSDALWVMDEVQLFGAGLPTTTQLDGLRHRFGVFGPAHTVWMSATVQPDWLETADHPAPGPGHTLRLDAADAAHPVLSQRLHADKLLRRLPLSDSPKDRGYSRALAGFVREHHQPGTLTLIIANTVGRARAIYEGLKGAQADVVLIHSRFRPPERRALNQRLSEPVPPQGRIIVATQVVEAGVDISARLLITELAPWSSVVQRLGRCNRYGEQTDAAVFWIDVDAKQAMPYAADDLTQCRTILQELEGSSVAPANLPPVRLRPGEADVLRARDLLDLFDTTPDLSGNDIDVARFVREADERNVSVFWRTWAAAGLPQDDFAEPHRDELCPAPIEEVRVLLRKERRAWTWDHLTGRWTSVRPGSLYPGQTILLRSEEGGYDPRVGWAPASRAAVSEVPRPAGRAAEAVSDDPNSDRAWQTIADHTDQVVAELNRACSGITGLGISTEWLEALQTAVRWHDAGKAHFVFQKTLLSAAETDEERADRAAMTWAKAPRTGKRHERPHFRHEVAGALALLQNDGQGRAASLAAYLVAAHHGRARLTLRSLPGEEAPPEAGRRFVLGVWDGDDLPETDLGGGQQMPATTLDLAPMELGAGTDGAPSWMERLLELRNDPDLGPFRLAYLEALLRAADVRASAVYREEAGQ